MQIIHFLFNLLIYISKSTNFIQNNTFIIIINKKTYILIYPNISQYILKDLQKIEYKIPN